MAAVATLLGLGIAEGLLRVIPEPELPVFRTVEGDPLFTPDTLLGWVPTPDAASRVWSVEYDISVRSNSLGIRGPEIETDTDCLVVALGDSFVHGLTVDLADHFVSVAERAIRLRTGRECRVVPAGVEGYSTDQSLLRYVRDVRPYHPDLVVHFFYYNDVVCNTPEGAANCSLGAPERDVYELVGDSLARVPTTSPPAAARAEPPPTSKDRQALPLTTVRRWLNAHSELYSLARSTTLGLASGSLTSRPNYRSSLFLRPSPRTLDVYRLELDSLTRSAWSLTERLLDSLAVTVVDDDAHFALFHVPLRETVYLEQWELGSAYQGWESEAWSPTRVTETLAEICARLSLDCLDPTEYFRDLREREGAQLYLMNDPHWNREGHAVVGRLLAEQIIEILQLTPDAPTGPGM